MVIIAIAGGTFVAKQYFSTESKTTKLTFENIGKLSTQEVRCTTVKSESKDRKLFGKSIPFTKSEIIYSYDTDIQAGYDFTKIRYTVKDGAKNEKGKICVHLPEVEIISCDIDKDSFKLYHEDDNIFSPIDLQIYISSNICHPDVRNQEIRKHRSYQSSPNSNFLNQKIICNYIDSRTYQCCPHAMCSFF